MYTGLAGGFSDTFFRNFANFPQVKFPYKFKSNKKTACHDENYFIKTNCSIKIPDILFWKCNDIPENLAYSKNPASKKNIF